jgi:hypothetical protein
LAEAVPKWIQVHTITPRGNRMLDRQLVRMRSRHARHKRLGEDENLVRIRSGANWHQNMQAPAA